jgi:type I restriction enzyme M protein
MWVDTASASPDTDQVWFYHMGADGWSLDYKRQPLLDNDKLGATPATPLSEAEHAKNNLPDVLACWSEREGAERELCVVKLLN